MARMRELSRWFDRKFPFGRDVVLHPNLRARLRGTPARLEEACAGLPPALLTWHTGGSWAIQENAGHLGDLEELWFARLPQFPPGAAPLPAPAPAHPTPPAGPADPPPS